MMSEKKIYVIGTALCVVLLCMILSVLFPEGKSEAAAYAEPDMPGNGSESTEFAENPQNRPINGRTGAPSGYPDELSAMPCCMIDNASNASNALEALEGDDEPETEDETDPKEAETAQEEKAFQIYKIAGELPDPELQRAIYDALLEAGIPYWYEGALAQCFQESHFLQYAVNPGNGVDSGLYQYRSTFWDWSQGDIFDTGAQIRRYAAEMAARFNAGLSADEAISRHKTSDYCTAVDWEYVRQVRQWLSKMEVAG